MQDEDRRNRIEGSWNNNSELPTKAQYKYWSKKLGGADVWIVALCPAFTKTDILDINVSNTAC